MEHTVLQLSFELWHGINTTRVLPVRLWNTRLSVLLWMLLHRENQVRGLTALLTKEQSDALLIGGFVLALVVSAMFPLSTLLF